MRAGAARLVDRDLLMLNMTRDEHFHIALALELFESFPTTGKRMVVWQGTHIDLPAEAIVHASTFLRERLSSEPADGGPRP